MMAHLDLTERMALAHLFTDRGRFASVFLLVVLAMILHLLCGAWLPSARRLASQCQSFSGQPIHADAGLGSVHRQGAVGLRRDPHGDRPAVAAGG